MNSTTGYPRFIETSPKGEDLYQTGAQNKTATSISQHINKNESFSHLIGLDGSWGAGKSNVISIISKTLKPTHHIFIYDAWSHQEDLQRRSFLEELTDDLQKHHVIDQKEGREKLKNLLAKKKETTQKTVPKLSMALVVSFFIAILTPVTVVIATVIEKTAWKIMLAGGPLIIALIVWGIAMIRNKKYRNILDLFYLYKQKELETTTSEIITDLEPSVREFRQWMLELESLLNKDIIVVFDNMDRLPAAKVQSLWSSIHTFFSESNIHRRIWILVPFDREHIKEAFSNDSVRANHFINKTFAVIFRVPPVVLTDWWSFFEVKFKEAFGYAEESEFPIVKGIFDRYEKAITPRKIIAFINDLVTLKITWGDEIKMRYMALFLVNKELILQDPVASIIGQEYRSKVTELFPEDQEIDDHIAALVYNIPKETATQVALQRDIVLAIRENDIDRLNQLVLHKDFFHILEEIFSSEDMDFESSVTAIDALNGAGKTAYSRHVVNDIWTKLSIRQRKITINALAFDGAHRIILSNCPEAIRKPLVQYITRQYAAFRDMKGASYFEALRDLNTFIQEKKWDINLPDYIRQTRMEPAEFINYVSSAKEDFAYYGGNCNQDALDTYFTEKSDVLLKGPATLVYIKKEYAFPKLLEKIEMSFEIVAIPLEMLVTFIDIYRLLSPKRLLAKKIPDAIIDELLGKAANESKEYFELVAMVISRGESWTGGSTLSNSLLVKTDNPLVEEIAGRIESYITFGDLVGLTVSLKHPLLAAVLRSLILKSRGVSTAIIADIVPLFDGIIATTGVTDIQLLQKYDSWNHVFKEKLTDENLMKLVPTMSLYESSLKVKNEFTIHLFEVANSFIEKIEETHWNEIFQQEESYEFRLLGFLLTNEKLTALPNKAIEPIKNHLVVMGNEQEVKEHQKEVWDKLHQYADKRQVKGTIKNVRDSLITNGNINAELFKLFEGMMRITGSLDQRAGDFFRRVITPVVHDPACRELIQQHVDFYLELLRQAGDEGLDFIKLIRKLHEQEPHDVLLTEFAKGFDRVFSNRIKIIEATYYTTEHSADVTRKVRQIVENEGVLHFLVNNGIVDSNDPHPGTQKKLSVQFEFDGKSSQFQFNEGDWFDIP